MLSVYFLINHINRSGPVNVLFNHCKYIDRDIINPRIITLTKKKNRSLYEEFRSLGIDIIPLQLSYWELELNTANVAKKIDEIVSLDQEKSIVHAHGYHPTLIASLLSNRCTIATLHCICGEDFLNKYGVLQGRYMSARFRRSLKRLTHVVAISEYMREYYRPYCKSEIVKINNGVDFYSGPKYIPQPHAQKLGDPLCKSIVVVGHLSEEKNPLFVIRELKKCDLAFRCLFLGEGQLRDLCEKAIGNDDRFVLLGYCNNVREYLHSADLLISSSVSEGFPMAVLEGLSVGLPMLLSSIPPHEEIVRAMGVPNIRTFNLKDEGLVRLFLDAYDEKCDRAEISRKANELYSANAMAIKYMDLYLKV